MIEHCIYCMDLVQRMTLLLVGRGFGVKDPVRCLLCCIKRQLFALFSLTFFLLEKRRYVVFFFPWTELLN